MIRTIADVVVLSGAAWWWMTRWNAITAMYALDVLAALIDRNPEVIAAAAGCFAFALWLLWPLTHRKARSS